MHDPMTDDQKKKRDQGDMGGNGLDSGQDDDGSTGDSGGSDGA